ncbi:MAG: hypothetical protein ABI716_00885 [Candidatus Saccharibacteria bacterium]
MLRTTFQETGDLLVPLPAKDSSSYVVISRSQLNDLDKLLGSLSRREITANRLHRIYGTDGELIFEGRLGGTMRCQEISRDGQLRRPTFVPLGRRHSRRAQTATYGKTIAVFMYNDEPIVYTDNNGAPVIRSDGPVRRTSYYLICKDDLASLVV